MLWKRVKSQCKDKFDRIHQIYQAEDEDDAIEMAEDRIKRIIGRKGVFEKVWLTAGTLLASITYKFHTYGDCRKTQITRSQRSISCFCSTAHTEQELK